MIKYDNYILVSKLKGNCMKSDHWPIPLFHVSKSKFQKWT